jgi:Tol biopolymer transport system component
MRRAAILIAMMLASGLVANRTLAVLQTHTTAASLVNTTRPQVRLPGTIYVSQQGSIYAILGSKVRRLTLPSGGDWTQPRVLPDGTLLVIRRDDEYSDLYHVSASGHVLSQMTSDDQATGNPTLQLDHWILWPAISPDGTDVYFATDAPKPAPNQSYEVDFSLWSAPLSAAFTIGDSGVSGATRWSVPDVYTGGDIQPVPLPDGSVLYSSYANTGKGTVVTVLGLQTNPTSPMRSMTTPQQDCGAPAVAADGVTVAMVCTNSGQTADLEVATLEGNVLSPLRVLAANCLCNSPSWSSTGDNLLYMNAADPDGNFGLWYIANAGSAHPGSTRRVTDASVDLDATSAAAWSGR